MNELIKDGTTFAIEIEDTEGTYKGPQGDTSFIEITEEDSTIDIGKDNLARNKMNGSRDYKESILTGKSVSVTIPVEMTAAPVEGELPKTADLIKAFGVSSRSIVARITAGTANVTLNEVTLGDTSSFQLYDPVVVFEAGATHISYVESIVEDVKIVLGTDAVAPFSTGVEIGKITHLTPKNKITESLSVTKIKENKVERRASGLKGSDLTISANASQLLTMNGSFVGLNGEEVTNTTAFEPAYEMINPPVVEGACHFIDGESVSVSENSMTLTNNIVVLKDNCSENGNKKVVATGKRVIAGTMNPYQDSTEVNFKLDNSEKTVFYYYFNPDTVEGEKKEIIAVVIPKAKIIVNSDADSDGVYISSISWEAQVRNEDEKLRISFC